MIDNYIFTKHENDDSDILNLSRRQVPPQPVNFNFERCYFFKILNWSEIWIYFKDQNFNLPIFLEIINLF